MNVALVVVIENIQFDLLGTKTTSAASSEVILISM